ncbi:hypothetical protein [Conexibacter sp. CPCC 206217]|uniref:hypothetical protein n=1 Tax=Conexibacter sp. CPCC 206217 TaxID=3064574 RepID=UPI00271C21E4|nr:hypothetical protein [Conexibacter sp. CPCC 206217]MDO8210860.1 hypothetical protein [Conexibacter sp. CPCC 206217]
MDFVRGDGGESRRGLWRGCVRRAVGAAVAVVALAGACGAVVAAPAGAIVPQNAVGGVGSRWFSGSLIQQPGQNCIVLGSPGTEIMVSGIGSYGGRQGVIKVGDQYWTSLLVAVPGNPCGVGSSGISTDLILPRNTEIDGSRQIRCFYLPRNANTDAFVEVTGQTWSAFGSSGQICPAQASPSAYHQGAFNVGFRPLASGAMLEIFVPVRSTSTLLGAGGPDLFSWLTDATGVYANPGLSRVFANVFNSSGDQPFVYFAREQSAIPFWKDDAPSAPLDLRNRTEFFANFYVAGRPGTVSFQINRTDTPSPTPVIDSSSPAAGFNGTVAAGQDLIQIVPAADARGPNGGYAPFAWDKPGQNGNPFPNGEWDTPMTITWRFAPTSGSPVTGSQSFRTLAGPDSDADGVADIRDACPAVRGTGADGCLPSAPPDPDGDGVFGDQDRCPAAAAPGMIDGCPLGGGGTAPPTDGGTPPPGDSATPSPPVVPPSPGPTPIPPRGGPAPTPRPQLVAALKLKRNTRFTVRALRAGVKVRLACSQDATATVTFTVTRAIGRQLGLSGKDPAVTRAGGRCTKAKGVTVTLKPASRTLTRIARLSRPVSATLSARLTAAGAVAGGAKVAVKLG